MTIASNRGEQYNVATILMTEECCRCHMLFAIPLDLQNRLRRSHDNFYCPAGHSQQYTGKSEAEKLRDQLAIKERQLEDMDSRRRSAAAEAQMARYGERAQKAAKTRLKNRIAAGSCPCCKRNFENLQRHMKTKHPDFAEAQS